MNDPIIETPIATTPVLDPANTQPTADPVVQPVVNEPAKADLTGYIPKGKFDAVNNKVKDLEEKLTEIQRANLTKEQQFELDKQLLEQERLNLKVLQNKVLIKNKLYGSGLEETEIDDLVEQIVSSDESKSLATVETLSAVISRIKNQVSLDTKRTIMNADITPKPSNIVSDARTKLEDYSVEELNAMSIDQLNKLK